MSSKLLFIESMDFLGTIPQYHTLMMSFLVTWLVWYLAKRFYRNESPREPDDDEVERKLSNWYPEAMIPDPPMDHPSLKPRCISSRIGKRIVIDGMDCLNLSSHNYLGFSKSEKIEERAIAAIRKYGVGSCGPRGFYGTVDVHLELEERLAEFMKTEESIVYSYGFSTVASAISAYCKLRDIVFADEKVNFAVQKGLEASRSTVRYFSHNDPKDLDRLLEEQAAKDRKDPKSAAKIRRFLIIEGIYMNSGQVCPLPELIDLCEKYKLRIFIDESISFGTLGAGGKGVTEHFGIPISKVDMIIGSLELSLSSIGGFCVGSSFVIEHQRLSGLGYCFSASLPPLLTSAAIMALDLMESDRELFVTLKKNCLAIDRGLKKIDAFELSGFSESPVKHLYLRQELDNSREHEVLEKISKNCLENGLAVIKAAYLSVDQNITRPSLRICISADLNDDDIDFCVKTLENCSKRVLSP